MALNPEAQAAGRLRNSANRRTQRVTDLLLAAPALTESQRQRIIAALYVVPTLPEPTPRQSAIAEKRRRTRIGSEDLAS